MHGATARKHMHIDTDAHTRTHTHAQTHTHTHTPTHIHPQVPAHIWEAGNVWSSDVPGFLAVTLDNYVLNLEFRDVRNGTKTFSKTLKRD
jgi:hypothetical protein